MLDTDKRWEKLGDSLINYSLGIKPGAKLMIMMLEVESYPLALEFCKKGSSISSPIDLSLLKSRHLIRLVSA